MQNSNNGPVSFWPGSDGGYAEVNTDKRGLSVPPL